MNFDKYKCILLTASAIACCLITGCRAAESRADVPTGLLSAHEPDTGVKSPDMSALVDMPDQTVSHIVHYPGFVLSFNPTHHQPNWVAWELTESKVQNAVTSRKDGYGFAPDFEVEGSAQLYDYKRSGWTRGHMCPAGDMKWSCDAMEASFKLTNICPQASDLNAGAWNSLEEKCRQWAERDSAIVIICGPVLTDKLDRTIGDSKVTVPERFFKVVYAPYAKPPRAIGFVMPNSKVEGGMKSTAMSVDEVEAITGFDFCSYLPDEIEDVIESQCNLPQWNKRY